MSKVHFSGIKPSGDFHIGNYLGAVKQWVDYQKNIGPEDTFIFMLADLHVMTVPFDPHELRANRVDLTAWFIAAGLDVAKTTLFAQSDNPDHAYLAWIFNCTTPMGWMERMTQYKDKSAKQGERTSLGLLAYPNLQAADILLYDADEVPVGEDQRQHVELTRDIIKRFNRLYGDVFKETKFVGHKEVGRVMSLQDPTSKMSKTDDNQNGVIRLNDDADTIGKKVKRAVSDSGSEIRAGEDKPALTNLLSIHAAFSGKSIADLEEEYAGKQYGEYKSDLAEVIVEALAPIQKKHAELMDDPEYIYGILDQGLEKAREISSKKLQEVKEATGLTR